RLRTRPEVRGDRRRRGLRPGVPRLRDGPAGHGGPAVRTRRLTRRAVGARRRYHGRRVAAQPGARGGWVTTGTARWLARGLLVLTVAAVGAIVASHRPANPIGWLFLAEGLGFAVGVATDTYATYATRTGVAASPSVDWAAWLGAIL